MKQLVFSCIMVLSLFISTPILAQDYFKQRVYENMDFSTTIERKMYVEIDRKKYQVIKGENEDFVGQKISYDRLSRYFYIKRQKKAMNIGETITFLKYVGNDEGAKALQRAKNMSYAGQITVGSSYLGLLGFIPIALLDESGNEMPYIIYGGVLAAGLGAGYTLFYMGERKKTKVIRDHNRNIRKYSKPVIVKKSFTSYLSPNTLNFKPVSFSLTNPTPVPTFGLGWTF